MRYDWILFDADNTLFDFDQSERFALATALEDIGIAMSEEMLSLYHQINRATWRDFEDGKLEKSVLRTKRFDDFFEAIGTKSDASRFSKSYLYYLSTTSFMLDGARDLLEELSGPYKLAMITNGLKEVQRPRIRQADLFDLFDVIVVSDEIGHSKPDVRFFDYTFSEMGHPERSGALVVGDNLNSDIKGGNNYGLDTCWYNHHKIENDSEVKPTFEIDVLIDLRKILQNGNRKLGESS